MPMNQYGLGLLFTAKDNASATTRRVGQSMQQTTKSAQTLDQAVQSAFYTISSGQMVMNKGIGIIKAFGSTISDFGNFEHALAAVQGKMNATGSEMKLLEDAAINAGVATQFSPTEAVDGLSQLAAKGLNATDAVKTLVPALDLAAAGQLSVGDATNALIGTMKSYNMDVSEAGIVTDKLMKITSITGLEAKDFQTALSGSAAAGAMYGQSIDEVLVTLGLLRNANHGASRSMTATKEAMTKMATDPRSKRELKKYTEIYDKNTGKMRPMLDITNDLILATKHLSEERRNEIATTVYGRRGALVYAAALKASAKSTKNGVEVALQGIDAINKLRGEIGASEGTSKRFMATLHNTLKGQMELIKGTLQTISIMFGKAFGPILLPIAKGFYAILSRLVVVFKNMSPAIKIAVVGVGLLAGSVLVAIGALTIFKGVAMLIGPSLAKMAIQFKGAALTMKTSMPMILAISAGLFLLYKAYTQNWFGFRDGVHSFLEGAKVGLMSVWDASMLLWSGIKALADVVSPLVTWFSSLWSSANDVGSEKGLTFMQEFGRVIGVVVGGILAFKAVMIGAKIAMIGWRAVVILSKVSIIAWRAIVIAAKATMFLFRTGLLAMQLATIGMTAANGVLTGSFAALMVPMLPVIAVLAGIAAAGYAIYKAYQNIDDIIAQIKLFGAAVKSVLLDAWNVSIGAIKSGITWLWGKIQAVIDKIMWAKNQVASIGSNPWSSLKAQAESALKRKEERENGMDGMNSNPVSPTMPSTATGGRIAPIVHVNAPNQAPPVVYVQAEMDGDKIATKITAKQQQYKAQTGQPVSVVTG